MKGTPLISVIVPVLNAAPCLAVALASIRRQRWPRLELIIVDSSDDGTAWAVRAAAPEARHVWQEARGPSAARNAGLALATGEWIAFLDVDDEWADDTLTVLVAALKAQPTALFAIGKTRCEPAMVAPWVSPNLGAGLYRREVFTRVGLLDEGRRLAEDVEWFLRVRELGVAHATVDRETLCYRRRAGSLTAGRSWREFGLESMIRASLARRRRANGEAQELPPLAMATAPESPAPQARLIDIRPKTAASVWPTGPQLELLRAALRSGDAARAAWAEWRGAENLRELDFASWNLLPLAWRNLTAQGVADAALDECRGYYRYHWARNQVLLQRTATWVRAWQQRGMPVIVLKGAALLAGVYRDAGLRPMADIDLLVPGERMREAGASLEAEGWRPQTDYIPWAEVTPETQASFNWTRGDEQLDLHWHVLHRCQRPEVTRRFWERAVPLQLAGVATLQLGPEDALLHVCSHGMHYAPYPAIRWIADAAWILRTAGVQFDWDRVVTMAAATGSTLALRHGLDYAAREVQLPVPATVLAGLRAHRPTWRERLDFRRTTSVDEGGRAVRAWNLGRLLWRVGGRGSPWARWARMRNFLGARWRTVSLSQAAWLATRKAFTGYRGTTVAADPRGERA